MRTVFITSYALLTLFIILSFVQQNTEFVIYALVLVPLLILLHISDKTFKYSALALWGFVAWMTGHLLGGLGSIGGTRVYDLILIPLVGEPYLILKYDQFLHWFCYVVVALILGHILSHITKKEANKTAFAIILILAASGIGALNEIIEFIPVVFLNNQGVGGYINTALDIVMNFLGAITGTILYIKKK